MSPDPVILYLVMVRNQPDADLVDEMIAAFQDIDLAHQQLLVCANAKHAYQDFFLDVVLFRTAPGDITTDELEAIEVAEEEVARRGLLRA